MDIELGNVEINRKKVERYIKNAAENGTNIVVLPELWSTGYCLPRIGELLEEHTEVLLELQKLAKKYELTIVAGSIPTKENESIYNTLIVISKHGELVKQYSKVHLFKLMDEHHFLTAGNKDGLFQIDDVQAAGMVCYDLRFPEWFRLHAVSGAEIFFIVAEWPLSRIEQWKVMLQSRAIENQSFVIGCNRVGSDDNTTFGGHSIIVDPYGKILAEGSENEELVTASISIKLVEKARKFIPILQDRQPEVYEHFLIKEE